MRPAEPKGGTRRIKKEKYLGRACGAEEKRTDSESTGVGAPGNAAASSRNAIHITVYVEETKPLAENASQRQPVCGNRDEMTLVLALIGPSR